jgi:hypothetical protein
VATASLSHIRWVPPNGSPAPVTINLLRLATTNRVFLVSTGFFASKKTQGSSGIFVAKFHWVSG